MQYGTVQPGFCYAVQLIASKLSLMKMILVAVLLSPKVKRLTASCKQDFFYRLVFKQRIYLKGAYWFLWFILPPYTFYILSQRAWVLVLTSVKEEKHVILPTTLNFVVRRGKLGIYTLLNPPRIFWKFAPSGGYKECAVVCFA